MGESRSKHSPKYQMKHRLTGAAVIITGTLSVIFLLLRESAQIPGSEAVINVGVAESPVFQSNLVPLNVSSVNLNEKGTDPAENSPQSRLQETEPGEQPEKEEKAGREQASDRNLAGSPPDVPDGTLSGWSIRVGTFTKPENVERLSALLGDHGFDAKRTRVQTLSGEAIRIWLGPYAKRETADTVSARLYALRGEKGYITKHEP